MKLTLNAWNSKINNTSKVIVTLKRVKGSKELFSFGRQQLCNGKYVPYFFYGYDGKTFLSGGHWVNDFGLINLSVYGKNVQGVILNGNQCFLLDSIKLCEDEI